MPSGFLFVVSMVVALLAASEWARRVATRGMIAASAGVGSRPNGTRDGPAAVRPADEVVAIPQWQKDV